MKKILSVIQKVLDDEKLALAFSELESSEEMYKFLNKFDSGITKKEIQEFANEIKKIYSEYKKELTEEELKIVNGGRKFTQIPAMFLSVLTLVSAANIGATDSDTTNLHVRKRNNSSGFSQKFNGMKKWAKDLVTKHPGKVAFSGITVGVISFLLIREFINAKTVKELTNVLDEWWVKVKDDIKFNEFKETVEKIKKELIAKCKEKHPDKQIDEFEDYWDELSSENEGLSNHRLTSQYL